MRLIDCNRMRIVHIGKKWNHPADPCSKQMIKFLERNESVISWLQPEGKGVEDQIPCIMVGNKFCALSLRMMKSIWRHVRLRKGFVNMEPLSHGGAKLKIPSLLLQEKIRTQNRFNVSVQMPPRPIVNGFLLYIYTTAHPRPYFGQGLISQLQVMRQKINESTITKERRSTSIMSKRISSMLLEVILPMGKNVEQLPKKTRFILTEVDSLRNIFKSIQRDCPKIAANKEKLLKEVERAYDAAA